MSNIPSPLFILEMANNHMGDVAHGKRIIDSFAEVCADFPYRFAFKFQYRQLSTFIHPDYQDRTDIKYIKRFRETELTTNDYLELANYAKSKSFMTLCTPFDESSVDLIEEHQYDFIKIASCSFSDWPLLERIVKSKKPIIASTAGASVEDIDRVVSFLVHREKDFAIMHCVACYPTPDSEQNLNQILFLKNRYTNAKVGFSTHEAPTDTYTVKMAIAMGAELFEKHVGVVTEKYALNNYSSTPEQYRAWLESVRSAFAAVGPAGKRVIGNDAETQSLLSLRRGVYLKKDVPAGTVLTTADVFFAMPVQPGQATANDWSKYSEYKTTQAIAKNQPLMEADSKHSDTRLAVNKIVIEVKEMIRQSGINIPRMVDLEISHHYGIDRFHEVGATLLTLINREYCKKLIVMLPGQLHPEQLHKVKNETFHILHGELIATLDGEEKVLSTGDILTIETNTRHAFVSPKGAIIEEISTTHIKDDSYYTDPNILPGSARKTYVSHWLY
jgi:sialic acid synthase SpsE/quercetin dioxygenase-like cupin family protein